jgi:hypothetical protein
MKKVISDKISHSELVDRVFNELEDSNYDWSASKCNDVTGPDIIASNEKYYNDVRFAIVCSSGKPSSSIRKMNFFPETRYSWVYAPQNLDDHREMRRFMLRLGVAYLNIFSKSKVELTLNYNNTDAKIPISHQYEPPERFDSVDADKYILKQSERYQYNEKAFRSGDEPDLDSFEL